jgi:hypothetical protein
MAERELSAAMLAAMTAGKVLPVLFIELEYYSGGAAYLRLFTGIGTLSWDSKDWTGGGDLLEISPIKESTSLSAIGFRVKISGLPADKVQIALASMRKNRSGKIWVGFFDASTGDLVADPFLAQRGRFDMAPISRDGATMTIEAQYEDRLVLLEKPGGPNGERRYTPEDQALRLAGDRGFDMVAQLQEMPAKWGTSQA